MKTWQETLRAIDSELAAPPGTPMAGKEEAHAYFYNLNRDNLLALRAKIVADPVAWEAEERAREIKFAASWEAGLDALTR